MNSDLIGSNENIDECAFRLPFIKILRVEKKFQFYANFSEFAIYICESALPNGFETLSAYTRFDYNWRENRAFVSSFCFGLRTKLVLQFLLLFKHLKFLIKRRCFLTALNVAKLILLKDPSDPLGMHLIVDALSLKSGQHKFLLDYYEHFKVSISVTPQITAANKSLGIPCRRFTKHEIQYRFRSSLFGHRKR